MDGDTFPIVLFSKPQALVKGVVHYVIWPKLFQMSYKGTHVISKLARTIKCNV